jgi:glycosyltransferase involved in cell wall biosynthesis
LKPYRIAYITETHPNDRHAWSGTAYFVYQALKNAGYSVTHLGPAKPGLIRYVFAFLNKLSLIIFKKRFDYRHSIAYSKSFGKIFNAKLKNNPHDIIVVCGASEYGAFLKTSKPVFYVLDRTIAGALNYHTILSDLWAFSKRQSIDVDKKAMQGAAGLLFSSEWAAEHARKNYSIPDSNIHVVPFGANMDELPERELALKKKNMTECKLLLVGTYWKNKGADIACNVLEILQRKGITSSLTIVGCTPEEAINNPRVSVIPFLNKNTTEGAAQLKELYLSHHFFILPTRFDCTPIVYCEASAFGLPVISSDTGGVRGHVAEGKNGFLIDYNDKGQKYAEKIAEVFTDKNAYRTLCESTRNEFEARLNWKSWVKEFENILIRQSK